MPRLALTPELPRRMAACHPASLCLRTHNHLRRWISSQGDATAGRSLACTWLTTTPEKITPDEILSSSPIPELKPEHGYTPVLLVTPAFAHLVDSSHNFLEQWMNRLYSSPSDHTSRTPRHAVVAIVDRLPNNGFTAGDKTVTEADGVAILFSKAEDIQGKVAPPRQVRALEAEEPTLLFSFRKEVESTGDEITYRPTHEIGLRLANTIFVNGKESTLFGTRWVYDPTLKRLALEKLADLSTCVVTVNPQDIRQSLELPLHPIGERRKVISSMGNILRQIAKHTDAQSSDPMPASAELEKELPRYIAEHGIADRRVSVWALVETTADSAFAKSGYTADSLAKSIQMGGKLHRVMSGGGGWGKKQGLLSLDPETSFHQAGSTQLFTLNYILSSDADISVQETFLSCEKGPIVEDLSTLSQAAGAGDYIQFFASTEPIHTQESRLEAPKAATERLTCHFGLVSDAETATSQAGEQRNLLIAPNFFGALSEKAITYLQPVVGVSSNQPLLETRTKIDIPGSRVELVLK
ncbi:hypothetical protein P175DRAFT_0515481 [Aspergillus ochraceoroseus IBT 24754]|uniref:Uncharacterized protein n=3 Tax=Aspergillus subgen. Nidulantes TaxID=2720870 RepID=A0A0F8WKX7_9EURO|nr:uncharacterized protein P175DRAFT_0515481 [Aspergillus ochraceoroseus IBT 24754]KKK15755.1 hypothetical protein AOCH_002810 [Aspergillus ochraceoroseus]KKK18385.1 hypothetical protein ARAM_001854 [Aspergillus rambellii]PTU21316.1 hypothetical protein P175DRAFT_0515481 [Aspergillus ochraceoroseus IBT 24754]